MMNKAMKNLTLVSASKRLRSQSRQQAVQQSDLKRQSYSSLRGISEENLTLVKTLLDQADVLFARASLLLNGVDKEKLIEINFYIKQLYIKEQASDVRSCRAELKCWYEQRQFLLQTAMSAEQKQQLKAINRQLKFILDTVNHHRGNQKLNKLFNHLNDELGQEQGMDCNNQGNKAAARFTTPGYLASPQARLTINLAS